MKPVKQEHKFGCAVACVAFVLNKTYSETLKLFRDGEKRVKTSINFYCPEIIQVLNNNGLRYTWREIINVKREYKNGSIVFIKKSHNYPFGHFLCKCDNQWMDPWINLPNENIEAGFRNDLPDKPTHVIFPFI